MNRAQQAVDAMERILHRAEKEGRILTPLEDNEWVRLKSIANPNHNPRRKTMKSVQSIKKARLTRVHSSGSDLTFEHSLADATGNNPNNLDLGPVREEKAEAGHQRGKAYDSGYVSFKTLFGEKTLAPGTVLPGGAFEVLGGDVENPDNVLIDDALVTPPVFGSLPISRMATLEETVKDFVVDDVVRSEWVLRDGALTPADAPLFSEKIITPFTTGTIVRLLRQSQYAARGVEYTRQSIATSITRGIEDAMMVTTANAPLSVMDQASVSAIPAVPLDATTGNQLLDVTKDYLDYTKEDRTNNNAMFLLHDDFRAKTTMIPRSATVDYPLYGETLNGMVGFPTEVTRSLPVVAGPPDVSQALFGDFSSILFVAFGPGVELVVNPYQAGDFEAGHYQMRVIGDFSWSIRDPKRLWRFDTNITV